MASLASALLPLVPCVSESSLRSVPGIIHKLVEDSCVKDSVDGNDADLWFFFFSSRTLKIPLECFNLASA